MNNECLLGSLSVIRNCRKIQRCNKSSHQIHTLVLYLETVEKFTVRKYA